MTRLTLTPMKTHPDLLRLMEEARKRPPMTKAEREAQQKSWVIGEMLIEHDDMTREEAERIYAQVVGE